MDERAPVDDLYITLSSDLGERQGHHTEFRTYLPEKINLTDEHRVAMVEFYAPELQKQDLLYVYCSLIKPQIFGKGYAPILKIINNRPPGPIYQHFAEPQYFELISDEFSMVDISIKGARGALIPGKTGPIVLVLRFKVRSKF